MTTFDRSQVRRHKPCHCGIGDHSSGKTCPRCGIHHHGQNRECRDCRDVQRPAHKGWTGTRKPTGGGVARYLREAS